MGHYAKVQDGVVTQVIVADAEFMATFSDPEPGVWVKTSYNTRGGVHYSTNQAGEIQPSVDQSKALRMNYAGIGHWYNEDLDMFTLPQPYPSWVLDTSVGMWNAPTPCPDIGSYVWDEEALQWVLSAVE